MVSFTKFANLPEKPFFAKNSSECQSLHRGRSHGKSYPGIYQSHHFPHYGEGVACGPTPVVLIELVFERSPDNRLMLPRRKLCPKDPYPASMARRGHDDGPGLACLAHFPFDFRNLLFGIYDRLGKNMNRCC